MLNRMSIEHTFGLTHPTLIAQTQATLNASATGAKACPEVLQRVVLQTADKGTHCK